MEGELITAAEMARRTRIPGSTARRYLEQYGEFFNPRREGRRILYPADRAELLETIAGYYSRGLTREQIFEELRNHHQETRDIEITPQEPAREVAGLENLTGALRLIADQKTAIEDLQQDNRARAQEIRALNERIKRLEAKTERQEEPWWKGSWWRRLWRR